MCASNVHVIFSGYLSQIFVGHHTRDIRKSMAMFVEYSLNIFRKYSLNITAANIREYSYKCGNVHGIFSEYFS